MIGRYWAVLVPVMLATMPVQAAEWNQAGSLPEYGVSVFVDDTSLSVDHDVIVRGWVRFVYDQPREVDGRMLAGHDSLRMADCRTRRYWVVEGWGRLPGDDASPVRLYSSAQEWQVPAPDSESEIAVQALCSEARSWLGVAWDKLKGALGSD